MNQPNDFDFHTEWSPDDGQHVGLCAQFPSLSWLADTPQEALAGIQKVVADALAH